MRISGNNPTLNPHLYCKLCAEIFREPMRLSCGHTFCDQCVKRDVKGKCPQCNKRLIVSQQQRDILAGRLVDELQVECVNNGCPWKGTYLDYKFHIDKCELKAGVEGFLARMNSLKEQTQRDLCLLQSKATSPTKDPESLPASSQKPQSVDPHQPSQPTQTQEAASVSVPASHHTSFQIDHNWGTEAERKIKLPEKSDEQKEDS